MKTEKPLLSKLAEIYSQKNKLEQQENKLKNQMATVHESVCNITQRMHDEIRHQISEVLAAEDRPLTLTEIISYFPSDVFDYIGKYALQSAVHWNLGVLGNLGKINEKYYRPREQLYSLTDKQEK